MLTFRTFSREKGVGIEREWIHAERDLVCATARNAFDRINETYTLS